MSFYYIIIKGKRASDVGRPCILIGSPWTSSDYQLVFTDVPHPRLVFLYYHNGTL